MTPSEYALATDPARIKRLQAKAMASYDAVMAQLKAGGEYGRTEKGGKA